MGSFSNFFICKKYLSDGKQKVNIAEIYMNAFVLANVWLLAKQLNTFWFSDLTVKFFETNERLKCRKTEKSRPEPNTAELTYGIGNFLETLDWMLLAVILVIMFSVAHFGTAWLGHFFNNSL